MKIDLSKKEWKDVLQHIYAGFCPDGSSKSLMEKITSQMKSQDSLHGHTVEEIKIWRAKESDAGRPCGLSDFWNAHGVPHGDPANQPRNPGPIPV